MLSLHRDPNRLLLASSRRKCNNDASRTACRFQVHVTWHSLRSAFFLFRSNPTTACDAAAVFRAMHARMREMSRVSLLPCREGSFFLGGEGKENKILVLARGLPLVNERIYVMPIGSERLRECDPYQAIASASPA